VVIYFSCLLVGSTWLARAGWLRGTVVEMVEKIYTSLHQKPMQNNRNYSSATLGFVQRESKSATGSRELTSERQFTSICSHFKQVGGLYKAY